MKFFYAFIFALFVSVASLGQITLLTPVTSGAPHIDDGVVYSGYFPNNTTPHVYNLSSSGTSNSYSLTYNAGFERYVLISRMPNGKWRMRANIAFAGVFYYDVAVYETVESYDTVDPPCDALYQLTTTNSGVVTIGGQYQLQFSTPCGNTNLPSICAIDYNPKLISLASMTHTIMNGLTAADGLRQGSIAYNNNANRMKYYDGVRWNEIYSPTNNLALEPTKQIALLDAVSSSNNLTLSKNSSHQLEINKGVKVFGESNFSGVVTIGSSLSVTGNLKSISTITEKLLILNPDASFPNVITPTTPVSIIVFKGVNASQGTQLVLPAATLVEAGRIYTIKNHTNSIGIIISPAIQTSGTTTTSSLSAGQSIRIMSDGTNWITI